MIRFEDVTFCYPQKDLYNKISFEIETGEHAVLIGSNGTGKSSLLKLIMDTDRYTYEGKIIKDAGARIGFIDQYVKHGSEEMTSFEFLAKPFIELQKKADEACAVLETAEDMEAAYGAYQVCLDEIDAVDGYNYESNIYKELAAAGLTDIAELPVTNISGGEYKLLAIIRGMLLKPQLLIMDEPDVFLDFENLIGLMKLINSYEGTLLAITHSRLLLNNCFDKILHIENEELQEFPGTYREYNDAMLETKINMLETASKFDDFLDIQRENIERMRKEATDKPDPRKGRQLKARVSYMERLQKKKGKYPFIEDHGEGFVFPEVEVPEFPGADPIISVKDYSLIYDKQILSGVNFKIFRGEKVAIVGNNGTGKSSLLRDVYHSFSVTNPGEAVFFKQIYDADARDNMSGGERNAAQLREICESGASVLFLDEPTSHLDIYSQIALEKAVNAYKGTVIMVSHDFYTVTDCVDRILILENGTLREMSGRSYRKSIYKKYFGADVFEEEKRRKEKEMRINALIKSRKYEEARAVFNEK